MNFKAPTPIKLLSAAATLLASIAVAVPPSAAQAPSPLPVGRVKIASNFVQANGCHETTQQFVTKVPFTDRLDRSYRGVLDGIEVVETAGNNGHAFRNFTWNADGTISYQLYAKGAGTWIDAPKAFGVKIGGGYAIEPKVARRASTSTPTIEQSDSNQCAGARSPAHIRVRSLRLKCAPGHSLAERVAITLTTNARAT